MSSNPLVPRPAALRAAFSVSMCAAALLLGGCLATAPSIGSNSPQAVSGGAAGASSSGANGKLETCTETLGVIRIEENTNAAWYGHWYGRVGSTVPLLRIMIQQSNCFVIVERGRGLQGIDSERNRARSDEARAGTNFQQGQEVPADYSLRPEIAMSGRTGSVGGVLSALPVPGLLRAAAGSGSINEAETTLILNDVRSTVQIAAAQGASKNIDFGFLGGFLGGGGAVGVSGFSRTPEGKLVAAAFVDAYNKMVVSLRNYKAQTVKGGLGTGGRLGVQGGQTPASQEIKKK